MTPEPTALQQAICDRLVGLPYVCLVEDPRSASRYVCQLSNGDKVKAGEIEQIFNAGLIIEALEGRGAATRSTAATGGMADKVHGELLAHAERLFGTTISDALPIYMAMERTSFGRLEDRPRVKWPRPQLN